MTVRPCCFSRAGRLYEDETHERKWLAVTAIHLCKDRLKSFARRNVGSIDDDRMPEIAAPESEDHSDVLDAVMNLPPKLKDVILIFYYDGYQTDEIAAIPSRSMRIRA